MNHDEPVTTTKTTQTATIGRIVVYTPPQECLGPESLDTYPAIITQVNKATDDAPETVELATFGPNSLYFQHKVAFSPETKPSTWTWPTKV